MCRLRNWRSFSLTYAHLLFFIFFARNVVCLNMLLVAVVVCFYIWQVATGGVHRVGFQDFEIAIYYTSYMPNTRTSWDFHLFDIKQFFLIFHRISFFKMYSNNFSFYRRGHILGRLNTPVIFQVQSQVSIYVETEMY